MTARTPVTVIGGYLGAGKTTLVNHLLRNAGGRRLAILVNDFGALPIDADLIEAQDDDLISIAGGCVCCSFGSDLMGALMKLAEREPAPDHLLIETSGVALPGSVARSVALIARYSIDGVSVIVDSETVRARAADPYMGDTITRQLAEADLVIANKIDLIGPRALMELREWIGRAAPRARSVEATRGQVPVEVMFEIASDVARPATGGLASGAFASGAIRAPVDASARYDSASFEVPGAIDVARLAQALAEPACGLVRAKGMLRDLDGSMKTLHLVGARFELTPFAGAGTSGLACIGLRGQLDRAAIERAIGPANAAIFLKNP